MKWFGILLITIVSSSALILPSDRMGPWNRSNVGVEGGIPDSSKMTVFTNISSGVSLTTLNNTLASCPSNSVVQLASGTYTFSGNVVIPNGVVLRGSGMSNSIIVFTSGGISVGGIGFYNAIRNGQYSGGGSANWTAGYSQNSSNLTLSATSPGLSPGNILFLDQSNDTFYVNDIGYEGASTSGPRDGNHSMSQFTEVTAINGSIVTVWPPVASTWVTSGLGPGAVWIGQSTWTSRVGVESLTLDGSASTGAGTYGANVDMECVRDCWVKGIKSIGAHVSHIFFGFGSFRCELRDSYLYATQAAASQSYGVTLDWVSCFLCENNVFEKVVGSMLPHASTSVNVFIYNYVTNEYYTASANFLMAGIQPHDPHCYMELFEGNHNTKYSGDFIHGSHSHEVLFRNRITGWEAFSYPSGPTVNNLQCEQLDPTNRYCSSVGNILGTAGKYSQYQSVPTAPLFPYSATAIYALGIANTTPNGGGYSLSWGNDTNTASTFFRHMDYDVVTGGITYNSTNADVTLPSSLVYSSKPAYFGNLNWPPFNPTNTSAAAIDPTNIPAGYWRNFGVYPSQSIYPVITNVTLILK